MANQAEEFETEERKKYWAEGFAAGFAKGAEAQLNQDMALLKRRHWTEAASDISNADLAAERARRLDNAMSRIADEEMKKGGNDVARMNKRWLACLEHEILAAEKRGEERGYELGIINERLASGAEPITHAELMRRLVAIRAEARRPARGKP